MNAPMQSLWRLQETDAEAERLRQQRASLDNGATLRGQLDVWRGQKQALRAKLEATRGELKDAELRLGGLEQKKANEEKELYGGHTTNPREVVDLQRDLASLVEVQDRLETQVLGLMDSLEDFKKRLAETNQQVEEGEKELARIEANFASETERIEARLRQLEGERKALADSLDPGLFERYEQIRKSAGGRGASLVLRGACSECRMGVPTYVIREIRESSSLVTCQHCGRLLCLMAEQRTEVDVKAVLGNNEEGETYE